MTTIPNRASIQGTDGNDNIENTLNSAIIQALAGNDSIYNEGSYVTIEGGNGDDSISNCGKENQNILINGGSGNDSITNIEGSNVTISAGNGNDLIRNGDEENDLQGGSNVSINGGVGDDSIINVSGYYVTIDGGANNDSIRNYYSSEVTVNGGDGNDSITNYEISHVSINGGTGNDSIISEVSYETTIDGGTGNDSIISKESYVNIINGGNGSDYIEVSGEVNSINGGAGNDKISLSGSGNLIQYASGDGNDTIWGFTSDDTLKISEDYASTAKSGSDIIVTVDNEKIILKNAANLSILNIRDGDTIDNSTDGVTVNGTRGGDEITNSGNSVTINGNAGNDVIYSDGNSVKINGNAGSDIIYSDGDSVKINGGNDNDDIEYNGQSNSVSGGNGNDYISNSVSASLNGGGIFIACHSDVETIGFSIEKMQFIRSDNGLIDGGTGDDNIINGGKNASINGGAGNDSIRNALVIYAWNEETQQYEKGTSPDNTTINGGAGNDTIENYGSNVTITGGAGNDHISLSSESENTLIDYSSGDGNDTVWGFNEDDTLSISGGSYSTQKSGSNIIVTVGNGKITLNGAASLDAVNIDGTERISLDIRGTNGNDSIENTLDDATIQAFAGNDSIYNDGSSVSINGGTGNDTIISEGSNNTIFGGTGNDIISLSSDHYDDEWNLILYTAGDGNDTIWGIGEYDTLRISSGTYSTMARGNDIIFKVGNGSITLKDAREIDEEPVWTLKGTTATCKIDDETKITVKGVKSTSGLTLSGDTIIVSASSLGTQKITVSDGYTLVLDDDVKEAEVKDAEWTLKNTTATLSQKQSAGYVCNGSSITYSNKTATVTLATLTGIQSLDGLSVDDNVITLSEDALGSSTVKLTKGDYKLELDDSVVTEPTSEPTWIISGTKATYKDGNSAYYSLASNGKSVNFVKAAADNNAKDLITLNGVNKNFSANDVEIDETNQVVTLYDHALNKKTVTIAGTENYSLALGDDVKEAEVENAEWTLKNTTATLSQKQSVGYVCNGSSITYSSKAVTATLATLTGVQSVDGLSVNGNVIMLSKEALGSSTVTLTKGNYTLELDDDVITEPTTEPTWFISGTKATYKDGNSSYYSLASNGKSVNFVKAAADKKAENLITLNGVNKNFSANDVEIDETNQVVTLYDHALNKKTITIAGTENYSLALGDDVKEAKVENAEWTLKNTTATLSQKQSVGYVCNGGSITYSSKSATATLATLTGIQSVDGLSVDGNVIMLSEDALGSSTVKLTKGDYKLALDDDVATEPTTEPTWFISGNKATYKDGNSAYYSLASNGKSVNFVKATADNNAENLITLNGVNKNFSADDVEIDEDNQIVILSNTALDKKNVTIGGSEDYSLALGDDVIEPELGKPKLEVKGSKATLTQSTSIGYVLTNDKTITYSKKVSATTLATVTGVKSKSGISFDESSITLANSALTNKVTVSGDVSFEFKANYKNASITGSKDDDVISVLGTGVSVTGGKGDDYFTSGGGNTFIYASGDGDDVIADFTSNDRLKVTSGDFTVDTNGNDVIVSVTKGNVTGSITLSDAAGQFIAIIDSNNKGHHYFTSASDYWFDENSFDTDIQISSLANFSETNNQIGSTANINDMNNSLESFNTFSNEEKYFANYCDKK